MNGLLSYKFSGENVAEVDALLAPVKNALEEEGHSLYVILYDKELRTPENLSIFKPKDFIFHIFRKMKDIEFVLVFLASPEKSEGMILEIGYALAKGIPVIIAKKEGIEDTYLPTIGTVTFTWSNQEDLLRQVRAVDLTSLKQESF